MQALPLEIGEFSGKEKLRIRRNAGEPSLRHDAPLEALWRSVFPNASLDASCRRLGFDIAFLCYTLGKLGPALTEEGLGHIVVSDPANGFGAPAACLKLRS